LNGQGTDEDFTNISVTLLDIGSLYDQYMNQGYGTAKTGMQTLLNDYLAVAYPNGKVLKSIGCDYVTASGITASPAICGWTAAYSLSRQASLSAPLWRSATLGPPDTRWSFTPSRGVPY
jgi:hypothetical protein